MTEHRDPSANLADDYHRAHGQALQAAIEILTDAARLRRPRLDGSHEPADWGEFITLALADATANVGGIDVALAGRSGSWEAAGVRQLLESTVGSDEGSLWVHRTEPLTITLYVDELLADRTMAWREYDDAQTELTRRHDEAAAAEPNIDTSRYLWEYDRDQSGQWVARSAEAPPWSVDAWRVSLLDDGLAEDVVSELDERLATATGVYIPKSREALTELRQLEDERDARLGGDVDERLEEQRLNEWRAFGDEVKTRILAAAADLPGLAVPVEVLVDVETFRPPGQSTDADSVATRLVDDAIMLATSPDQLPGTPLERLGR